MGITNLSLGGLTDLVFENRNRQYGAYQLRSEYSNRLLIACISGISIIILLVVSPLIVNAFKGESIPDWIPEKEMPKLVDPPVVAPPQDEVKKDPSPPKPPAPRGLSLAGKPVDHDSSLVDNLFDPQRQGDPFGDSTLLDPLPTPPEPPAAGTITVKKEKEPERHADVMPVFDGDYRKWLASNLSYPAFAKDMGIQGTVYVEFVVDEEGNVTNAKLLRDIGSGCGEAALKAVRSMPKWKPGIKKGEKVKVYYTLPVKFSLR